jgi:hypothetical protein
LFNISQVFPQAPPRTTQTVYVIHPGR